MRSRLVVLLALLVLGVMAAPANASGFFTDDDGSVHVRAIEAIADEGITKGCNPPVNDLYCPTQPVTREQMATFLVRALDLPSGSVDFADVSATSVHAADIAALAAAGITRGCNPPDNTNFCPQDRVTREQMASFLVRALGLPSGSVDFADVSASSVHAADIAALAAAGITKGCNPPDNTNFCPGNSVTREQMASFLSRALGLDTSPRVVVNAGGDLIDVAAGTGESETVASLTSLLGTPTHDETRGCPYFGPVNTRYVSWGSLTAVIRIIDSGDGVLGLVGWRYKLDENGLPEPGGPLPSHIELPFGLELGDPIGDAAAAGGGSVTQTPYSWIVVELDDFSVEATGLSVDPDAPIDGVQQGIGYDCGG